jgi:hypothetical protein
VAEAFCAVEVGGFVGREEEGVFCVRREVGPPAWGGVGSGELVERGVDRVGGRRGGGVEDLCVVVQEEACVISVVFSVRRERSSYTPHSPSRRTLRGEGNAGGKK